MREREINSVTESYEKNNFAFYANFADLHLVVEKKDISLDADDGSGDFEEEKWDMISTGDTIPSDVGIGSPLTNSQETAKSQYSQKTDYNTSGFSSQSSLSMISRVSSAYSNPAQYPIAFNTKINTTGLFNAVCRNRAVLKH